MSEISPRYDDTLGEPEWPAELFTSTCADDPPVLRTATGRLHALDVRAWHAEASAEDLDVLARAVGPTLDVGCGPGRHTLALHRAGHDVLGIDSAPAAVRAAQRRGAPAVCVSVWGPVPRLGHWRTALILDGNIGIGGDPVRLLRRVRRLVGGRGRILVELSPGEEEQESEVAVQIETGRFTSPWLRWAFVTERSLPPLARAAELCVVSTWTAGHRHFGLLDTSPWTVAAAGT